jgi:hypothetical protein
MSGLRRKMLPFVWLQASTARGINEIFRSSGMLHSEEWYLPKFLDNLLDPSSRRLFGLFDF